MIQFFPQYFIMIFETCSIWFYYVILSLVGFVIIKIEIFGWYFWVVSSWYQSLGLRDSDTLPGVSELKLRGNKKIFKKENVL